MTLLLTSPFHERQNQGRNYGLRIRKRLGGIRLWEV